MHSPGTATTASKAAHTQDIACEASKVADVPCMPDALSEDAEKPCTVGAASKEASNITYAQYQHYSKCESERNGLKEELRRSERAQVTDKCKQQTCVNSTVPRWDDPCSP